MTLLDRIQEYRLHTFCYSPKDRITSKEKAIKYVNTRGYIYFWPITGVILPSLWGAVAGDRPVPNEHDDPAHVTWDWKDSLLGTHTWFYGKILRKKATIISLEVAPYFYALTENYGSPEEDYLTQYEQGRMTQEARLVYEAILENGPLDTITLKKAAHLTSAASDARFNKALTDLQSDFKIMPIGVADKGAWHYSFVFEIVTRHEPELMEKARYIGELDAMQKIVEFYFRSVGAAQNRDLTRLLGWKLPDINRITERLLSGGFIRHEKDLAGLPGEWFVLTSIGE